MNTGPTARTSLAVRWLRGVRGTVIVLVLVTVLLASLFVTRFIERTTTELFVEARAAQAARLRVDAASALELTLAVLADFRATDGGLHSPEQGWGDPLAWADYRPRAGVTVEVAFEDESGKPSLPRLDAAALQDLGELLGLRPEAAEHMADAVLTWTEPDHPPTFIETDPRNYERSAPPHHPPLRPLQSFAELASIDVARDYFYDENGRPTEQWERFAQSVSLYAFDAVNLNTSRPLTLALAGLDEAQSRQVADYLAGRGPHPAGAPPYFRGRGEVVALLGANAPVAGLGTEVRCLRISVTVHEGAAAFQLEAVVAPPGGVVAVVPPPEMDAGAGGQAPSPDPGLQYPFTILELHENMEPMAGPGGET